MQHFLTNFMFQFSRNCYKLQFVSYVYHHARVKQSEKVGTIKIIRTRSSWINEYFP